MPLDQATIQALIEKQKRPKGKAGLAQRTVDKQALLWEIRERIAWKPNMEEVYRNGEGPVTYTEERQQCIHEIPETNFRCVLPTYIRFDGEPYCASHALLKANEKLASIKGENNGSS